MTSNPPTISQTIDRYRTDFTAVLPTHINPEQWVRVTIGVIRRNPRLIEILQTNPGTMLAAMMDAARLGLEIGDTYHLVPFKNEIVGVTDYTGLIELMYRAGAVSAVKAEVVRQADRFDYSPAMDRPDHRPDWFADRGPVVGAYAYAEMKDGGVSKVVVRSQAEIEQVKDVSAAAKSNDSPWQKWPDRMALKTVVRELAKFVPTSAEHQAAATTIRPAPARTDPALDSEAAPLEINTATGEVLNEYDREDEPM
ncbi:recombination protein RecT [Brevibacterium epidermidis]|jgi:recombination protein RecT|uniref:Recombination protein RecT n=1 Tax=Brevibacterium epidermidis TaxID=1698 RepID=A0ABV4EPE7_BREEP